VNKALFEHNRYDRRCFTNLRVFCFVLGLSTIVSQASGENTKSPSSSRGHIENAIIVTQLPVTYPIPYQPTGTAIEQPDFSTEVLSHGFHSICNPEISFDASHILFAGKRIHRDNWTVFEMGIDGSNLRQVTNGEIPCRSPGYQSTLYTIVSPKPWQQLTFVG